MFEPSKGTSSPNDLAKLFMNNTATQPTAVPQITQPQQAPMPTFGSMAPMQAPQQQERAPMPPGFEQIQQPTLENVYGSNSLWQSPDGRMYDLQNKKWIDNTQFGGMGMDAAPTQSQYAPDVRMWIAGLGGGQTPKQAPQPSQAQMLARSMNDRFR